MNKPKTFWQKYFWVGLAVLCLGTYAALQSTWLMDTLKGWGYEPAEKIAEIEADLNLTATGRRIFRATHPTIEGSTEFNEHCNSYDTEVSLLGCYADGQIYIYEIKLSQIEMSNKVTAAHELLHATWERISAQERDRVSDLLSQVYDANQDWFKKELEVYDDKDLMEEIYARAGTKLQDLPAELEEYYSRYFQDRALIVQYYQEYEAPFLTLQSEMEELAAQIQDVSEEIETARESYLQVLSKLDAKIDQFNTCAETAGCFKTQTEFARQRQVLLAEQANLEKTREELNEKIAENNQRVQDYRDRQVQLGRLNDAMNSNIEFVETIK